MSIPYDYYRVFYYVAKYQSFTLAANVLYNSQPNITRTIKKLENELGCTLFVRSGRGATLTPNGEKLYAHVSVAFEQIQAGEDELSCEKSIQNGLVTVSVTEIALHCHVLKVLKEFHKEYPGIRIRLTNHSTPQALHELRTGLADLAVVTSPVFVESPLKSVPIKKFREVAVCSSCFSELARKKVSFRELCEYPIISLSNQTRSYEFYSDLFLKHGAVLHPEVEAATTDQVLPMVKNDLGIGFVPIDFIESDFHKGELVILDLTDPIPQRTICLIKNIERPSSIAAKALEKMLLKN